MVELHDACAGTADLFRSYCLQPRSTPVLTEKKEQDFVLLGFIREPWQSIHAGALYNQDQSCTGRAGTQIVLLSIYRKKLIS